MYYFQQILLYNLLKKIHILLCSRIVNNMNNILFKGYAIASANTQLGSYAIILPFIHQLQVMPLPLSDKTQAGSR